jgi:hypothetical protein
MRNVSQTAIAKRHEDLQFAGSQIYERKRRATLHELGMHIQRALGMQLHTHVAETLLESKSRTAIVCTGCCGAR